MKRRIMAVLIGIFVTGMFYSTLPATAEEKGVSTDATQPAQTEKDPAIDSSNGVMGMDDRGGRRLDNSLRFEAGQKTPSAEREAEALRLHQTTVLDRFQGSDNHGQILLSFSEDRVDLKLRSITGAEAPVAGRKLLPKK
ncbi:MAG: hypothetical protein HY282_05635 [Nitrospirae bacterium]|nr:hypothetical protein [Candidatus Manganitrophaceae bacterium]